METPSDFMITEFISIDITKKPRNRVMKIAKHMINISSKMEKESTLS